MLELLSRCTKEDDGVYIRSVFFSTFIVHTYQDIPKYKTSNSFEWLRNLGEETAQNPKTYLATITNVNDSHWVAVVIDFRKKCIRYGDSMPTTLQPGVYSEVDNALMWWTKYHTSKTFKAVLLPTTVQQDSHSCGLLAWNAIGHFLFPFRYYRLMDASNMNDERLEMLLRILRPPEVSFPFSLMFPSLIFMKTC
jgi:Ulp1 family protease